MIDIREWLFLTQSFLVQQVVCRRDIVMSIRFDTLHCVVWIETKFVKDLLIDGVLQGHQLLPWEQSRWLLVSELTVPRVIPDLFDSVTLAGFCDENFRDKVRAIG